MASSEATSVERLGLADVDDCLALSTEAGWNQVAADWRIFFDQGLVWGIRESGRVAASAALLPYPPTTAWISMVLTAGFARGRGFATRLMAEAVEEAARRGLAPRLDATPQGAPIYARLGFVAQRAIERWRRAGRSPIPAAADPLDPALIARAGALDAAAMGFERGDVIAALLTRGPASVAGDGLALVRDGRTAWQVGPVVAGNGRRAVELLTSVLRRLDEDAAVIVDACADAPELAVWLEREGFRRERPFTRMAKGDPPEGEPRRLFAIAGPELG